MPNILYASTAQLAQVEGFPEGCERTVKGALHVRPGSMAVVSEGEAAHLRARGVLFTVIAPPARPSAARKAIRPAAGPSGSSTSTGEPVASSEEK